MSEFSKKKRTLITILGEPPLRTNCFIKFVRTDTFENKLNFVSQKTYTLASYLELEKHFKQN